MKKVTWYYDEERQQLLHQSQSQRSVTPTKWYNRGKPAVQPEKGASSLSHDRTPHISHSWVFRTHRSAPKNTNGEKQPKKPVATSVVNIEEMKRKAQALEEIYEQKSKALQQLYEQKRRILNELYQERFGGSKLSLVEDRLKKAMQERKSHRRYLRERFNRLLDGPGDRNFSASSSEYDWSSMIGEDDDAVAVFNDRVFEEEFARSAPFRFSLQEERFKAVEREPVGSRPAFRVYSYSRIGPYRPSSAPNTELSSGLHKAPLETTYVFPDVSDYPEPGRDMAGGYLLGCAVKPQTGNIKTLRKLRKDEFLFRSDSPWIHSSDSSQFGGRPHSSRLPPRRHVKAAKELMTKEQNLMVPRSHPSNVRNRGSCHAGEVPSRPFTVPALNTMEENEKRQWSVIKIGRSTGRNGS